jgi:transcriptional regulator with XRE-family HTH domain
VSEHRWVVHSGKDLGRAVADIRHIRTRTQTDLSAEVGLGQTWLAKLETGRTSPVLEHLLRLLRRLGATVTITIDEPEKHDAS